MWFCFNSPHKTIPIFACGSCVSKAAKQKLHKLTEEVELHQTGQLRDYSNCFNYVEVVSGIIIAQQVKKEEERCIHTCEIQHAQVLPPSHLKEF